MNQYHQGNYRTPPGSATDEWTLYELPSFGWADFDLANWCHRHLIVCTKIPSVVNDSKGKR